MELEDYLDLEERQSGSLHEKAIRKLFSFILKEKSLVFWGACLILVGTAAMLLEPRLLGYAIDEAILQKKMDLLVQIVLLFFVVECVRVLSLVGQNYLFDFLGQRVMQILRLELFSHLQKLPISVFDKNPVGRLVTRITNDVSALAEMFSAGFVTLIGNFLTVIGIIILLFVLDWKLALVATAVFPMLSFFTYFFSKKLRVAYRNARSRLSALNAFLAENILGMRVVQLYCREKRHLEQFSKINQWYLEAQTASVRLYAYFQPTITIASGIAMSVVLAVGGAKAYRGEMQLGVLVAFFSYILTLFQPLREIADKWNIFLSGVAAAERIFSILSWKPEFSTQDKLLASAMSRSFRGHIRFENVWFAYQEDHWVLRDFSADIPSGAHIGIVGHTGAGKTTFIHLLLRFYEPTRGRILIDGKDIRDFDRRELRVGFGLVQQDVFLFSGSLWDNLTLGRRLKEAEKHKVEKILEQFGLSKKFERFLDERGSNLSMGERQIIAFLRALVKQPSMWILDEATSNVDSHSEVQFMKLLAEETAGKTVLQIAHRLATIRDADIIFLLHQGVLVEHGGHRELLKRNGLYSKLYQFQQMSEVYGRGRSVAFGPQ